MAKDPNEFARSVLDQIIAKHDPEASREQGKHPRAVALGIKGGAKGGHPRAKSISTEAQIDCAESSKSKVGQAQGYEILTFRSHSRRSSHHKILHFKTALD